MSKIQDLDLEKLGKAIISAYKVGDMANVQKVSTALKDNVDPTSASPENKFVYDLFTKKFEDVKKEWS